MLVHCSDGWDRTSQLCAVAELMLDPHYRTFAGFKTLVEKDWFEFGHMFRDRVWNPVKADQRSPVFIQFLDCVWQLLKQFPNEFEFNEEYVLAFADSFDSGKIAHSLPIPFLSHSHALLVSALLGWFGEFCFNSESERRAKGASKTMVSIWSHLRDCDEFRNLFYLPKKRVLVPICSVRTLQLWARYFHRHDSVFYPKFVTDSPDSQKVFLSLPCFPSFTVSRWDIYLVDVVVGTCFCGSRILCAVGSQRCGQRVPWL